MRELSPLEQEKWYAVAVGEIGIPPTDFYEMTEDELKIAEDKIQKITDSSVEEIDNLLAIKEKEVMSIQQKG